MSTKVSERSLVALYKKLGLELRYHPSRTGKVGYAIHGFKYKDCVIKCEVLNAKLGHAVFNPVPFVPKLLFTDYELYRRFIKVIFNRDDFDEKAFVRNLIGDTIFESIRQHTADAHLIYAVTKALTSDKESVIKAICMTYGC